MRRVTYKVLFQRENALVGAFLKLISEDYLGVIAKQFGDPVIVKTSE